MAFAICNAQLESSPSAATGMIFCFPGPTPSVSANGTGAAIVRAVENSSTQGVLLAYDATNPATELHNSSRAGARDPFGPGSKFTPPIVANGRLFVTSQYESGQNDLPDCGLLAPLRNPSSNFRAAWFPRPPRFCPPVRCPR